MGKDGDEIKVSASIMIRNRSAMPGEQADKDNGLTVTISYAEKHSDKINASFPDPNQPDLPGTKGDEPEE